MDTRKRQQAFLLLLLAFVCVLAFFIFQPFLVPLIFAAAIAVVFQPLFQGILRIIRGRRSIAAALTTLAIFIVFSLPLTILGAQVTREATDVYTAVAQNGTHNSVLEQANTVLRQFVPEFSVDITQYARQAVSWILPNIAGIFSSSAKFLLSTFVFFFALYYLLKDGTALRDALIRLSPLTDKDDELLFSKLHAAVTAVIRGNLTIALIQGGVATLGFFLFGVPNATLWGSVTAIAALIPGVGTALVVVPVAIYLFLTGNVPQALGMVAWGMAAVGLVDNLLGPRLLGKGTDLHPLLVFLSVLGGIALFGPMGILLGPILINLLLALLGLYANHIKNRTS